MSDQTTVIESPDLLESSSKGNGMRRANKLAIWIIGVLVIAALMSVVYTGELRNAVKKAQASSLDQDKYRVAGVVPPPIAKPAGPDVATPPTPPHPVYVQGQAPAQDPEWLKRRREAQAQAYQASLTADTDVPLSSSPSQNQAQVPMPMVNGTIPPTTPTTSPVWWRRGGNPSRSGRASAAKSVSGSNGSECFPVPEALKASGHITLRDKGWIGYSGRDDHRS